MSLKQWIGGLLGEAPPAEEGFIAVEALRQMMGGGSPLTLLDVRGVDEFDSATGHIAGAINIPLGELPQRVGEISTLAGQPVVIVCLTDRRSARAAAFLKEQGFADVTVLRGGMTAWNNLGLPTE